MAYDGLTAVAEKSRMRYHRTMALTLRNLHFHLDPLGLQGKRGSRLIRLSFLVIASLLALMAAAEILFFVVLLWQLLR